MVPEQVLVTGSLIHGTAAVGVPVTTLGAQDFTVTGSTTTADLFKTVPIANVPAFQSATDAGAKVEQTESINLFGLNGKGPRTLMLVDGYRFPGQGDSGCQIDPSIIPKLALDRVDILPDGASATYGSDAVAGVVNVILRRGYEGAITEGAFGFSPGDGHYMYRGSQLYGTKWSSGDLTLTYEYYQQRHTSGTARPYYTMNFNAAQGLDNRTPIVASMPGTVSVGAPASTAVAAINGFAYPVNGLSGSPGSFSATTGTSCTNCYAVPKGQNGTGLTWAQILANTPTAANGTTLGTGNVQNPYSTAWEQPDQFRSALVGTFDQNVMTDVQFFADGFYDNRRSIMLNASAGGSSPAPAQNNSLTVAVPTINPYYPAGAPNNLDVSYDFTYESPVHIAGNELALRYDGGFNINLPFGWLGKIYGSVSQDNEQAIETGLVNPGQVSAALGWTVPTGTVLASFTKPSNVPYLNVFCDAMVNTCNSAATMNFIHGFRDYLEDTIIHEYGATADGPVIALPGGDLKAAIGGIYYHEAFFDQDQENYNNPGTAQVTNLTEYERREVYSAFGQLDVPIIGDANRLPLIERLEVQGAVRYDHYNAFGGTTNPKVAGNWLIYDGFQLKGSWGTSFRVPSFQEAGFVSGTLIQPINAAAGATNNYTTCTSVGQAAVPGSAAAEIDPNCTAALQFLGGIRLGNGAAIANAVRPAGFTLQPEKGQNLNAGFDWAPDDPWFKGLDIQANYYFIKIRTSLPAVRWVQTATSWIIRFIRTVSLPHSKTRVFRVRFWHCSPTAGRSFPAFRLRPILRSSPTAPTAISAGNPPMASNSHPAMTWIWATGAPGTPA